MDHSFNEALEVAKAKYPYQINHYEEYRDYYVFDFVEDSDDIHYGGDMSPIVVRKSDLATLNYAPIFLSVIGDSDVGPMTSEGAI